MALTAQIDLKLPISLIRSTVLERLRQNGLYFLRARVVPPRTLKVNNRDVRILSYAILFPYLPTKAGCLCVAEIDGEEPLQFQELILGSNYLAANDFMINFKRNIVTCAMHFYTKAVELARNYFILEKIDHLTKHADMLLSKEYRQAMEK